MTTAKLVVPAGAFSQDKGNVALVPSQVNSTGRFLASTTSGLVNTNSVIVGVGLGVAMSCWWSVWVFSCTGGGVLRKKPQLVVTRSLSAKSGVV